MADRSAAGVWYRPFFFVFGQITSSASRIPRAGSVFPGRGMWFGQRGTGRSGFCGVSACRRGRGDGTFGNDSLTCACCLSLSDGRINARGRGVSGWKMIEARWASGGGYVPRSGERDLAAWRTCRWFAASPYMYSVANSHSTTTTILSSRDVCPAGSSTCKRPKRELRGEPGDGLSDPVGSEVLQRDSESATWSASPFRSSCGRASTPWHADAKDDRHVQMTSSQHPPVVPAHQAPE